MLRSCRPDAQGYCESWVSSALVLPCCERGQVSKTATHRVPEGPDDGVDDQLQLLRGHREQRAEAVVGDRPQQGKEVQPVLRVVLGTAHGLTFAVGQPRRPAGPQLPAGAHSCCGRMGPAVPSQPCSQHGLAHAAARPRRAHLEVGRDHAQRALEDGLKDARHLGLHLAVQLVDDGRKQAEHLRIPAPQRLSGAAMPARLCVLLVRQRQSSARCVKATCHKGERGTGPEAAMRLSGSDLLRQQGFGSPAFAPGS